MSEEFFIEVKSAVYFVDAKANLINYDVSSSLIVLFFFMIEKLFPGSMVCQTDEVTNFMTWSDEACFQFDIFHPAILKVAAETRISEG